jgi:hypothetical protein
MRVMFLETQLDRSPTSQRSEIRFIRELLETFGSVQLIAKEVHSREDLEKFLDVAREDPLIKAVHIVAHGEREGHECALVLTADEIVDLRERDNRNLFRRLDVESLFFSACNLGGDLGLMRKILEVSGADAVFSYARTVDDYEAFLTESLFYHLAYGHVRGRRSDMSFVEVFERLRFALDYLEIDPSRRSLADPLLAAVFAE